MQYLKIDNSTRLSDLTDRVGSQNLDKVLNANQLVRTPDVGQQFAKLCDSTIAASDEVDTQRKLSLLNKCTQDDDIFEITAMLDEAGWKLLSVLGNLPNYLAIPESVLITKAVDTLGSGVNVPRTVYDKTIDSFKLHGCADPSAFGHFSTMKSSQISSVSDSSNALNGVLDTAFHIPWGKISLYSSLADTMMDIPAYPEEISDGRSATYTQMPDLLYQYEPWQLYQSSGPRSVQYSFKLHRDMWNSNHNVGGANHLIRFCEANCYAKYDGSAVHTATVTLYLNGQPHITGVLTDVSVDWEGPLGHDGFYLAFTLKLSITEVSTSKLNFDAVAHKPLIGR